MAADPLDIIIHHHGTLRVIRLADIPEPARFAFQRWLAGQTIPLLPDYGDLAYAWDWERWLELGMPDSETKRI